MTTIINARLVFYGVTNLSSGPDHHMEGQLIPERKGGLGLS
jgi:hypothetical protein